MHTVRRGDSLYIIAHRYATTVKRLKQDNQLSSNTIQPGQKIRVVAVAQSGGQRSYRVVNGDTLGRIADAHKVSLSVLLRANGLGRSSRIYPGQQLIIPE